MADENDKEIDAETKVEAPGPEAADDVSFEPEDNEAKPAGFGKSKDDILAQLKEKLKETEKKAAEYLDGWQRLKADVVNLRKRDEEEKREAVKFANESLIAELLPVLESFESAFANKEAWEKADKNWRIGVEYIYSQLKGVLEQNGLRQINPAGETYDPARDEAVETVVVESEADGDKIVEVVRVGYELNGRELRAPKVKVGRFEGK